MKYFVSSLPFIGLIGTLVYTWAEFNYVVAGNALGYSLMTDAFMLYFVFKVRFCVYTKLCVIALTLLNIVCLAGTTISYPTYSKIYDTLIVGICLFACLVIYLMKRK